MFASLPHSAGLLAVFQVGHPLFGNQWLALLAVLAAIGALLVAVALLGRWLAATHPDAPVTAPAANVPLVAASTTTLDAGGLVVGADVAAEIVPVLLAAVAECLGAQARVLSIHRVASAPPAAPSIEALMQEWSHEGRRQIYSSHKVR